MKHSMRVTVWDYRVSAWARESMLCFEEAVTQIHPDAWILLDTMALDLRVMIPVRVELWGLRHTQEFGSGAQGVIRIIPYNSTGAQPTMALIFSDEWSWGYNNYLIPSRHRQEG